MNATQVKCLLVFVVLVLIGFGPLSLTCLIGLVVIATRPRWFFDLVHNLYGGKPISYTSPASCASANSARLKALFVLLGLLALDIAPVPVAGAIGLYVVIVRPKWFKRWVEKIYLGAKVDSSMEQFS